jgi:hypothetical protein
VTKTTSNPVEDLFPENTRDTSGLSVSEIIDLLGCHGIRNLAYDGDPGCNPGYVFRGEVDYDQPLRSSLEHRLHLDHKDHGTGLDEACLRRLERELVTTFVRGEGGDVAAIIDAQSNRKQSQPRDDVVWWLSVMRHYGHPTRFLDFTRDIRLALFFGIEQLDGALNRAEPERDLLIYCFPCMDPKTEDDPENNKAPIAPSANGIDMNRAIGCLMDLEWMRKHAIREKKAAQKFGWDRPHFANSRLHFQKGMLVYPFDYPEAPLEENNPTWLVRNLRATPSDPFHMGKHVRDLPAKRIRIKSSHARELKKHLEERYTLTKARVYVDFASVVLGFAGSKS